MFLLVALTALIVLEGRVDPPAKAAVTIHAADRPWTDSVLTRADGRFRFPELSSGSYTLSVYVPGKGEIRKTVSVGPSHADRKGRVRVTVESSGETLDRNRAHLISSRELAVPPDARRLYSEAERKLRDSDIPAAIAALERAVSIAPGFGAAWNHLGTIAYQTRRYQEAESYFRRALEVDPGLYEPLVNLGGVLVTIGNLEAAWRVNVEAVLARPSDALAQSQLGMTYLAMGKLDLAEKRLREAIRLDPAHFSHPQLQLAEVYARNNDRERAAEQLEAFLVQHPDSPRAPAIRDTIAKWRYDNR